MGTRTLGIVLIIVGLLVYLANIGVMSGEITLIALGAGLIVAYFTMGNKTGFLIAGSVVAAVGLFAALERWLPGDETGYLFFLFLALAFANVYLVELVVRGGGAWAGWVAVALAAFSVFIFIVEVETPLATSIKAWWPVLLVAAGLWLLFTGRKIGKGEE